MKCPHCLHAIKPEVETNEILRHGDDKWVVNTYTCPNCDKAVLILVQMVNIGGGYRLRDTRFIFPKASQKQSLPEEVTDEVVISDYNEACLVLSDSPKSSAALSRRCLQYILREKVGTKAKDLADQIQEVIEGNLLPSDIAEGLDAVRNIGNFAAHMQKSKATGEILDVEPHEAEWNIEILFDVIDYVYVRPVKFQKKKEGFNEKLSAAGKPTM